MFPLVSCIMPTYNRRAFVPLAIRYFLRQDYPNKELVILDDGSDPVADLVPQDDAIRYVRLPNKTPLGAKRNLACESARGDLFMHWDDDDWMAPQRISLQVEALLAQGAEICGLRQMLFFDPQANRTWLYTYPANQRPWLAGGSLLYTRAFWKQVPFAPVDIGEDTRFVWSRLLNRFVCLENYRFYVGLIHPTNTSSKLTQGIYWSAWDGSIKEVMGDDLDFYHPASQPLHKTVKVEDHQESAKNYQSNGGHNDSAIPAEKALRYDPAGQVEAGKNTFPAVHPGNLNFSNPRVSCILATGNRTHFTRQAIRCFLRQTLEDAELIVVDDGVEPVDDLCAGLLRVRYIRLETPTSLGAKLNIGIQHARGSIIQKLDDDDYYHPQFLERSVSSLNGKDQSLVAWDCFLVLFAGSNRLHFSGHGWSAGGTLCFHKKLWEQAKFRDLPREVDAWFLRDHHPEMKRLCAPEMYILLRHGRNTWRETNGTRVDDYLQRLPVYSKTVEDLVEPLDRSFYSSLQVEGM